MSQPTVHRHEPSSWAIGFTGFAAFILIMLGIFDILAGLAGIFRNEFYVVTSDYVFRLNVTAWGWIHLIVGVIVFAAGIGIFSGSTWARAIGVFMAIVICIENFLFLPYYPLWSILIIAIAIAVIWALTAHGRDITEA